jgi:hypothetical protein
MNKASGVLIAEQRVQRSRPAPRLRLLTEWEPRHRVFFGNLADLILSRRVPPIFISSRPAAFWNDVFVPSGAPWSSFLESTLGHLLLILLLVWIQSRAGAPVKLFARQETFQKPITYTPPAQSFPAAESRAANVPTRARVKHGSAHHAAAHPPAIPVRPEQKPGLVAPPDIKQATSGLPNILASHATPPMVPFSAIAGQQRKGLAGLSGVVAPPPAQIDQATGRRLALPQTSAVAPAPEFGGPAVGRAVKVAGLRVVLPPPPSIQNGGGFGRAERMSSVSGTGPNVVPPPPSIQSAGNASGDARLGSMAGTGPRVVPPPPSVQGSDGMAGGTRLGSLSGVGSEVVPPPPLVGGGGNSGVRGRLGSLSGGSSQIVPPPPSVEGAGSSGAGGRTGSLVGGGSQIISPPPSIEGTGSGGAAGRAGWLAGGDSRIISPPPSIEGTGNGGAGGRAGSVVGGGSQIVPPPPSIGGAGNGGAGGRAGSLVGGGSQIVPPPPSIGGAGNGGAGGRLGSLAGDGSQMASPAPSVGSAGNAGAGGLAKATDPQPVVASSASVASSSASAADNENKPSIEELPLGLIGLVFAPPGTSFFSNFEVFVAKRRVGKDQLQLIKMVYEFLPYQRRLSEYDLSNLPPRVIKLRVIPDPKCDESLGKMIQPYTDSARGATEYPKLPEALLSTDLNAVLPCYRTTADDFQKAMSRAR